MKKLLLPLVFLLCVRAAPSTVAQAVAEGKSLVGARHYDAAIQTLQGAVPAATEITSDSERAQALAAIHFYTALAFHGLRNDVKAGEQLEEYFRFSPAPAKLDPARYDAAFIRLFRDVNARSAHPATETKFDLLYPGFREFSTDKPRVRPVSEWASSPDFQYVATAEEQQAFRRLHEDEARARFVNDFWAKRDAAFRTEFEARVAFADYSFGTEKLRGSLTDRGQVFIFLGRPRVITVKNLTRADGATMSRMERRPYDGTVERWYFFPDQLPAKAPRRQVEFKFITEEGYGQAILQREYLPMKALAEARPRP